MTNNTLLRPRHLLAGGILSISAVLGFAGCAAYDSVAQATEPTIEPTDITLEIEPTAPEPTITLEPTPEPTEEPTVEPEPTEEPEAEPIDEPEPEVIPEPDLIMPDLLTATEVCHAAAWAGYDAMVMDDEGLALHFEELLDLCQELSDLPTPDVEWEAWVEDTNELYEDWDTPNQ